MSFKSEWLEIRDQGFLSWFLDKCFGLAKPAALPMRAFSDNPADEFCWEDWKAQAKKEHPVRYFLSETVPLWWSVHVRHPVFNAWYWFRTNTWNRYHKLDLRQPYTDTDDDYRWGWLDEDHQLIFACFNVLSVYVKSGRSQDFIYGIDDIDKLRESLVEQGIENPDEESCQLKCLKEVKEIYEYWTVDRKTLLRERANLLTEWASKQKSPEKEVLWKKMNEADEYFDNLEEEMLIRLIKIRQSLWT